MNDSEFRGWIAIGAFFCGTGVVGLLLSKYAEGAFALLVFVPLTTYLITLFIRRRRAEQGRGRNDRRGDRG
jgi:membrane protein implicated in regulation of membrane protease activity